MTTATDTEYIVTEAANRHEVYDRINGELVGYFTARAAYYIGRSGRHVELDDEFVASCGAAGAIAYMTGLA